MRGSVIGQVVRAGTGIPVPDASIGIAAVRRSASPEPAVTSDSEGAFTFVGIPEGRWVLDATHVSGRGTSTPFYVFDNAATEVTIEVRAAGASKGKSPKPGPGGVGGYVVLAGERTPVPYATVRIVRGPAQLPEQAIGTDASGSFTLAGLPPGRWVLSATSPGLYGEAAVEVFADALTDITIEVSSAHDGGTEPSPDVEGAMRGSLRGRVVRADTGKPVSEAAITVVRGAGPAADFSPLTNAEGLFVMDNLPAGEWLLRARGPDGATGVGKAQVPGGGVAEMTIYLG